MRDEWTHGRRKWLQAGLFGAAGIGLRSVATGIPIRLLMDPLRAVAQPNVPANFFILSTSSGGDPLNANVPGTYGEGKSKIAHPTDASMAPTSLQLGGRTYTAARPWAELPAAMLSRTAFIHHETHTQAHPSQPKVMKLMGAMNRNEMFLSAFSSELAEALGTIQREPVSLGARGGELLSYRGRTLANVSPKSMKQVMGGGDGPLAELMAMRDRELDRINDILKRDGTENQRRMVDRFVQTREEARQLSDTLISRLDAIKGNGQVDQAIAAPVLAALKVTPVITMKIRFGGDNHGDGGLQKETEQTVEGVQSLVELFDAVQDLKGAGELNHGVTLGCMNVFGRTLSKKGTAGRDHNSRHHCTVLIGDNVNTGVYGDLKPVGNDWGATALDSKTGAGVSDGDIPAKQSLSAVGKTLGAVLGIPRSAIDDYVNQGKVIEAVVKT